MTSGGMKIDNAKSDSMRVRRHEVRGIKSGTVALEIVHRIGNRAQ
jgi:hypothetical protein